MGSAATSVVELVGLPGSGKTTLAAGLRDHPGAGPAWTVADAGVSARAPRIARIVRRAAYAGRSATRHPALALRAARLLAGSGQPGRTDAARILLQWLATEHLLERAHRRPGVQVLEEGAAQTIWTAVLRSHRLRPEQLWACLPAAARSDLVVVVEVSPELAARRLGNRVSRHSRTQRLEPAERLGELRVGQSLLDLVISSCPAPVTRATRSGQARVEEVRGDLLCAPPGPGPRG